MASEIDRRTRKRDARRTALLSVAADLVERMGPTGFTMAALAEAADYAPASLYTYFPSRSALLAALQRDALAMLGALAEVEVAAWDQALAGMRVPAQRAALARLLLFAELFLRAPNEHPREFRLQQQLLVAAGAEDPDDAAGVVPAAFAVLDVPRRLLAEAVAARALTPAPAPTIAVDGDLLRTLAWVTGMNGALMVDGIAGLPVSGAALGRQLTEDLLRGWDARPTHLETANEVCAAVERISR